jgi:hypothetical protein
VARWIRKNVAAGETVYVAPNYDLYSLMFHAPHALCAWQFDNRDNPQFKELPPVHIKGEVMPDWLVGFGPYVGQLQNDLNQYGAPGVNYHLAAKVDVFWQELYRPELFWRTFKPISGYNKNRDVVFIFKRAGGPGK